MSDKYNIHEKVGKGAYGDVYRATQIATGELMAIKIIDLEYSEDDIEEVRKEISVMSELQSDYLTRLHESFAEGCKLYIVMEFLDGGSVRDLLDGNGRSVFRSTLRLHTARSCARFKILTFKWKNSS